jgi:hypothetical protein
MSSGSGWGLCEMGIRKAVIKAFDSGTYTATVQVAGSLAVWLEGVPVARNIAAAEAVVGRSCAVIFFDEANPQDAVVAAVYTA